MNKTILEAQWQKDFIIWCEKRGFYTALNPYNPARDYVGCVFAVPNGGNRNLVEAAEMKRQGLLAGVSDLIIMFKDGDIYFLENKQLQGKQSPKQVDFEAVCGLLGFKYCLCKSIFEATRLVIDKINKI